MSFHDDVDYRLIEKSSWTSTAITSLTGSDTEDQDENDTTGWYGDDGAVNVITDNVVYNPGTHKHVRIGQWNWPFDRDWEEM